MNLRALPKVQLALITVGSDQSNSVEHGDLKHCSRDGNTLEMTESGQASTTAVAAESPAASALPSKDNVEAENANVESPEEMLVDEKVNPRSREKANLVVY